MQGAPVLDYGLAWTKVILASCVCSYRVSEYACHPMIDNLLSTNKPGCQLAIIFNMLTVPFRSVLVSDENSTSLTVCVSISLRVLKARDPKSVHTLQSACITFQICAILDIDIVRSRQCV